MADDHYVAQTYLKNFTNPNGMLIPYFKKGKIIVGKSKSPKSVCYVPEGSSNPHFNNPRILEEFLTPLENNWNENLVKLERGEITPQVKFEIASYLSVLRVNTPTAIRQSRTRLESYANLTASQELFHNDDFSQKLNDKKYAHARNLFILDQLPITLCSSDWKVLFANGNNFLTSDNPLCLYYPNVNSTDGWFYAPLKPNIALLIWPDLKYSEIIKERRYDELPEGNIEYGKIKSKFIFKYNQNLVRHAEEKVFFNQEADWITRLVKLNRGWKAVAQVDTIPQPDGYLSIFRDVVKENQD